MSFLNLSNFIGKKITLIKNSTNYIRVDDIYMRLDNLKLNSQNETIINIIPMEHKLPGQSRTWIPGERLAFDRLYTGSIITNKYNYTFYFELTYEPVDLISVGHLRYTAKNGKWIKH